jgi:eukaryotic-like serine/threonine-protein kinase
LEVTGSPSPVTQEVTYSTGEGSAQFTVSDTGLAVYRSGRGGAPVYEALWVDPRGETSAMWEGARTYAEPRISPDGTKVSFMVFADNDWDLWVYDRVRKVSTRLTFAPGLDGPGVWSPDSRYVAYSSGPGSLSLYRKRADGSGDAEQITESKVAQYINSWSGDGKYLLYSELSNGNDLWMVPVDGDRKPRAFLATNFQENEGAFAPDGRWIAYQSNESGRMEVYVRPVSGAGKWQISEGGGGYPRWSGDGRQLFFRDNEGVMSVPIKAAGDSIEVGRAQRALKGSFRGGADGFSVGSLRVADYDVSRDGSHFVMFPLDAKTAGRGEHLTFVLNWFTELQRLLPSKN